MEAARVTGTDNTPGIACSLAVEEAGTQEERWKRLGREAGLGRRHTEDGLEVRFLDKPAVERELRALVAVESRCCAWARWEVRRADGELLMRVTSTPEGAAVLHEMFSTGATASGTPE